MSNDFINIDYGWLPRLDLCWDITTGIPFDSNSIKGIYTEHCLEHINFLPCQNVINDFFRLLQPGGVVRIIVPDAELYINLYIKSKNGETVTFPYVTDEEFETGFFPIMAVNRVFRNHGHLYYHYFDTISMMLRKAGFVDISKESFMKGRDRRMLMDSEERTVESLYVEEVKPL